MLRALIAELCEPRRYARAKEYARDDAVIDIEIRPGRVVGSVQGSRREPYVAVVEIDPSDPTALAAAGAPDAKAGVLNALLPSPDELAVACTCPDFEPGRLCKHAAAVLLVLTDELTIEPTLLVRWRSPAPDPRVVLGETPDDVADPAIPGVGASPSGTVRLPGRRPEPASPPMPASSASPRATRSRVDDASASDTITADAAASPPPRVDPLAGLFELRQPLAALPTPAPLDLVRWLTAAAAGDLAPADELLIECATILALDARP